VVESKKTASETLLKISDFIKTSINLDINEKKTKIFPVNQGVNTIGFKIYATHKLLRNESKKRIKQKAKKLKRLIVEEKITSRKAEQIFNSWLGHACNGNSINFINSLIKRNDYIYIDIKGKIRINEDKLKGETHDN